MKIVYIDSQNIHQWLLQYHWWIIDWKRFFVYLGDKYKVDKVKIFFWYLKSQRGFYQKLRNIWYEVCFKETLVLPNWGIKGNVDIDIAIFAHNRQQAMGNIITLLGLGKKVYMRSDITPWKLFEDIEVKIYDIGEITLEPLEENVKNENKNRIKTYFSKENYLRQLHQLFGDE